MWIFMWKDDLRMRLNSSPGPSTPQSSSPGPLTRLSYSSKPYGSASSQGKAECLNCKLLAERIKTLEAKIKILEETLEMKRHYENHTFDSTTILHELYNDMGRLREGCKSYRRSDRPVEAVHCQASRRIQELIKVLPIWSTGQIEFYYSQLPKSMASTGVALVCTWNDCWKPGWESNCGSCEWAHKTRRKSQLGGEQYEPGSP
nr:hypothetical protein [Tanacetum cinerariifolium]